MRSEGLLSLQLVHDARTVAVSFGARAESLQHGQPYVAQRRVFRQDEVLAEFQLGSAAGENRWAISEVVNGADV